METSSEDDREIVLPSAISSYAPATGLRVVACPHPFSTERIDLCLPAGGSIADILKAVNIPLDVGIDARVFIDDFFIERDRWKEVHPEEGHVLSVRVIPGKGRGGKMVLGLVLSIALVAAGAAAGFAIGGAAFGSGPVALGLTGAQIGMAVGGMVGSFVSQILVSAIAPPPKPKMGSLGGVQSDSSVRSITGSRNQNNKYGPVPRIFGKYKMFPPMGRCPLPMKQMNTHAHE